VTSEEDQVYCITQKGQMIVANLNLQMEDHQQHNTEFEHVICPFHKDAVTGLDVCIRKQLIATCSRDKTVCIWNYEKRDLEISSIPFAEECLAIAFHPSGLHLVVALGDKVIICNVLSSKLT